MWDLDEDTPVLEPPAEAARPVVALDVDGVLRPVPTRDTVALPGPGAMAGWVAHEVRVPGHLLPDSPFHRLTPGQDVTVGMLLNPAHGAWVRRLLERADVVWATTWEHAANVLAPLLGVPELPVAVSVATCPPRFGQVKNGAVFEWKLHALSGVVGARPLAFVDDLAWPAGHLPTEALVHGYDHYREAFARSGEDPEEVFGTEEFPDYERMCELGSRHVVHRLRVDGVEYPDSDAFEEATGEALVTVDGPGRWRERGEWVAYRSHPRLFLAPHCADGMTEEHMAAVDEWLDHLGDGTRML